MRDFTDDLRDQRRRLGEAETYLNVAEGRNRIVELESEMQRPDLWDDAELAKRVNSEYAATKGIKTMVENHGFFCQESFRVEQLITAVDHPNFGVLVDMGNFLCADEDPASAVARLMPFAFHCHAKDFHVKPGTDVAPGKGWFQSRAGNYLRGAIIGHGNVPIIQCLKVMQRDGYKGVLSIEYEGIEDVLMGVQMGHDNLRRMVAMLD